ncbi:MAG: hypothetical protein IPO21_02325 [Bacteroidales bacterium]|nr:hypothetical protein [Bacteroidales bacterium]
MTFDNHIIVCPIEHSSAHEIKDKTVVLKTSSLDNVSIAVEKFKNNNNIIHAVLFVPDKPLSEFNFDIALPNCKIVCFASKLGEYSILRKQFPYIHKNKILFFFEPNSEESFLSVKLLSTLNIAVGFKLNSKDILWQDLLDICFHTLYSKASHYIFEPINYLISDFKKEGTIHIESSYFDNFRRYLHLSDTTMQLALTQDDLKNKNFIADGFESLLLKETETVYEKKIAEWHAVFIENKPCATCVAWRLCNGSFLSYCDKGMSEPVAFFSEILEAIQSKNNRVGEISI